MDKNIRKKISSFPHHSGCYIMKNGEGKVLYVGKAKDLRKRVYSYLRARDVKTYALMHEIAGLEYILTSSEVEALILEAQLIQEEHPKYNIDLQSSGRYAFIKITEEEFPRLLIARKLEKKGTFIGPYTSAAARNEVLRSAERIFRLCKQRIRKKKPCFRHHLGYCCGACVGAISPAEYQELIHEVKKFLNGDFLPLIKKTRANMESAAEKYEFEKAKVYRDRLFALEKLKEQKAVRAKTYDQDVVNGLFSVSSARIQIFHFHRAIISGRKEYIFDLSSIHRSEPGEVFFDFISQYYRSHDIPHEIIVPLNFPAQDTLAQFLRKQSGHSVKLTVPQKGEKRKLLDLVYKNLVYIHGKGGGQLFELEEALRLSHSPRRIACVDISTLGGTNTVGSLVQFMNGQPWKGGYRRFRIKGVIGVNDYAAIEEVISRFAHRIKNGREHIPDLLVIDGGKGQLSSAKKALLKQGIEMPMAALAKRLEKVYTTWSSNPLQLSPRSPALQLLRAIRDEAHRFSVTYQRKRRRYV